MSRQSLDFDAYYQQYAATSEMLEDTIVDWYDIYQRVFDVLLSTIGIMMSIPFIVIFGIAVKLDSPGPVFYTQERVGKGGRRFKVIKLRSMIRDAEKNGAQWAEKDDPRVTRVGRFIRKTRIDELPQFINVLRGDMSIIGPRPERPEFVIEFNEHIPGFIERLCVRPGLTGWAQVNGGYEITPEEKLALDLYYIENRNPKLDLLILVKTLQVVFTGHGAR
jgi:exopolysaccharide biosynthesis polyprenyl glycosylphosphotransferase